MNYNVKFQVWISHNLLKSSKNSPRQSLFALLTLKPTFLDCACRFMLEYITKGELVILCKSQPKNSHIQSLSVVFIFGIWNLFFFHANLCYDRLTICPETQINVFQLDQFFCCCKNQPKIAILDILRLVSDKFQKCKHQEATISNFSLVFSNCRLYSLSSSTKLCFLAIRNIRHNIVKRLT